MGVNLLSYATRRRSGMEAREAGDVVNDFGRNPIGEGKEEQVGLNIRVIVWGIVMYLTSFARRNTTGT